MKCKKCVNVEKDPATGYLICLTCGNVVEDSSIVQGIEFDSNQKATGTFIDSTKGNFYGGAFSSGFCHIMDPIQVRLNKVYKYMVQIATLLTIPTTVIERAKKLYNVASNKKFTQGRRTKTIVGAILYLACRWDCTKHLLMDFSEALQINLFVIGSIYLKLVRLLEMEIKIIDPSLFMHRFCIKFNFKNKTKNVEETALKILQFLERDWITTGRRPSGLCGACILISAKLHGFNLTITEVANAVHVCNETIKKRINEFSLTRVAAMTKEEFEGFQKTHYYYGMNPPAFIRNREKEKLEEEKKVAEANKNNNNTNNNNNNNDENNKPEEEEEIFLKPQNIKREKSIRSETELLSRLEDNDVTNYLYTESEYMVRKKIWEIMYRNWIEEQEEKKMFEKGPRKESVAGSSSVANKKTKSRKTSIALSQDGLKQTPYEAIKNSNKFGRKVNYCHIKSLFNKPNN